MMDPDATAKMFGVKLVARVEWAANALKALIEEGYSGPLDMDGSYSVVQTVWDETRSPKDALFACVYMAMQGICHDDFLFNFETQMVRGLQEALLALSCGDKFALLREVIDLVEREMQESYETVFRSTHASYIAKLLFFYEHIGLDIPKMGDARTYYRILRIAFGANMVDSVSVDRLDLSIQELKDAIDLLERMLTQELV